MDNALLSALVGGLITGIFSIAVSFIKSNKTIAILEERYKTMREELVKLANKVETHNNFGLQLARLETRVDILEKR